MMTLLAQTDWWSVSATWVAALVAAIYTLFTYQLLRESQRQRMAASEPLVIVSVTQDPVARSIIMLVIENFGKTTAYDVRFRADRPIPRGAYGIEGPSGEPRFMDSGPFAIGIPALPPGGRREFSWGQFGGLQHALGGKPLKITAEYSTPDRRITTESIVEVSSFENADASERDPVQACARQLERLVAEVQKAFRSHDAVRVQLVNLKQEAEEARRRFAERQQQRESGQKE